MTTWMNLEDVINKIIQALDNFTYLRYIKVYSYKVSCRMNGGYQGPSEVVQLV
jgi:hypothetical protein